MATPGRAQVFQGTIVLDGAPPTARTAALGGAGIALGDDASAALLNPAALARLVRGEVTSDFGFALRKDPFVSGGNVSVPAGDTAAVSTLQIDAAESYVPEATFAFVYPASRFGWGAYVRVPDYQKPRFPGLRSTSQATSITLTETGTMGGTVLRSQYAGTIGVPVGPHLAVGAAVIVDYTDFNGGGSAQFVSPTINFVNYSVSTSADPLRVGYHIGVDWMSGPIRAGVMYRAPIDRPVTIERSTTLVGGPPPGTTFTESATGTVSTPRVFGGGIAVRATETLRFVADVVNSQRSDEAAGLAALLDVAPSDIRVADVTEVRAGVEFVVPFSGRAIVLRAGLRTVPEHDPQYVGADPVRRAVLAPRSGDQLHKTFGVGYAVNRFEFNATGDVSDRRRAALLAAVVRFD